MRKSLLLPLWLAGFTLLAASCRSTTSARQRYHQTPSGLEATSARSDYMEQRVAEMTQKGMNPKAAAAQASHEWFRQASIASATPTAWELQRRAAQAKFEADLAEQKKEASVR